MQQPHGPVLVVLEKVDSYQAQLLTGVRTELVPLGVPVLLHVSGVQERIPASLRRLVEHRQVSGLLVTAVTEPTAHRELQDLAAAGVGLPTVQIGQAAEGGVAVLADNREGMRLVARHLVEVAGARRVLAVRGLQHQPDSLDREEALREALAELGLPLPDELVVDGAFSRAESFAAVQAALARGLRFDAVAAFNDRSALGAVDALVAAGLRVPEDVVVTGFDDEDVAALAKPSLTTVDQNLPVQGATAARLLLELMAGRPASSTRVPVRLLHRETTGGPPPGNGPQDRMCARLVAVDGVLEISREVLAAPTVEAVIERISSHLPRLGISRAFLVLRTDEPGTPRGFVALAYHDGTFDDLVHEQTFDLVDQLLPPHLAVHLRHGMLALQPLLAGDAELGYLLLEQVLGDHAVVGEALGMDLSRALDNIRTTGRLARHAEELEAEVVERTRQLEEEIATRRHAEEELRRVNAELRASLHLDGLTGIANRAAFEEGLATQWAQHSRSEQPLSLLMVDVDHFKAYNDRYGHLKGDDALRTVAACLQSSVRRLGDLAARYGGEEFALLLPNTDADGALVVAARTRELLRRAAITHADSPVDQRLTISIGVASVQPDALGDPQELIASADAALYDVKDAGRDGVACARGRPRVIPFARPER